MLFGNIDVGDGCWSLPLGDAIGWRERWDVGDRFFTFHRSTLRAFSRYGSRYFKVWLPGIFQVRLFWHTWKHYFFTGFFTWKYLEPYLENERNVVNQREKKVSNKIFNMKIFNMNGSLSKLALVSLSNSQNSYHHWLSYYLVWLPRAPCDQCHLKLQVCLHID